MFSVRVPDDVVAAFDAATAPVGGRSAALRRFIIAEAGAAAGAAAAGPRPCRLMVRLDTASALHVAVQAEAMALRPAGWVAALVRRHAGGGTSFSRGEERSLLVIQSELRRIRVNVNQIASALNAGLLESRVLDLELRAIADLQREIRENLEGVQAFATARARYWLDPG